MGRFVQEEAKKIPIANEADIVVLGGGCTGVFAAVRAARLGARVVLIEQSNCFGGVATNGFVCVWHTLMDTTLRRQVISGLTEEVIERLKLLPNGVHIVELPQTGPLEFITDNYSTHHLNTEELKIELDILVLESGVVPYLHTKYVAPYLKDGELAGVYIENNNGRSVICGKYFIDATADGYLGAAVGMKTYRHETLQPATTAARIYGWEDLTNPNDILRSAEDEIGCQVGWDDIFPGVHNLRNWFKSNIALDCSESDTLTASEIQGRLQVRKMLNILREKDPMGQKLALVALSSVLGLREARQLKCSYQLKGEDIYTGKSFEDAIAYSSYPVDIHHENKPTTYRYLNGFEEIVKVGASSTYVRWKTADTYPTFWQIPYRSILPEKISNMLICGRCIDADKDAFGAIRVMTSLNQTGEAAGVAAFEALSSGKRVQDIDVPAMRRQMKAGGSFIMIA
jgi:hypothetical protein